MSEFTTVKVAKATRDRLNAIAQAEGCTAGGLIERLLDEHQWRERMAFTVAQMQQASPKDRDDDEADERVFDALASDGLADYADDAWPELT